MNADYDGEGLLKIKIESKLYYGGKEIKIEIRDSDLILIKPATTQRIFELPVGLYELSTVLDDGKRTIKNFKVSARTTTVLELKPDQPFQPPVSEKKSDYYSLDKLQKLHPETSDIELVDISSNVEIHPSEGYWVIYHSEEMKQVSVATIQKSGSVIRASLPICTGTHRYSATCHIKRHSERVTQPLQINISQTRSIASAMESMVAAGQLESAIRLASSALKTLTEKFIDPPGAALAALILHKADRLQPHQKMLEKLTEFDWLPDSKILLASLLFQDPTRHQEALQLACEASKQRILFTEAFSLLLNLLRYWPDSAANNARNEALSLMAKSASHIDWRSIYLCERLKEAPGC